MCHFTPSGLLIKRKRRHHVNWWYKVWSVVSMCDVHCCPWCWYDCLDTIWSFHLIITDDEHLPCDQLNMQNIVESVAKNSNLIHLCFKYTRCSVCDWIKASRPLQEFMYVRICWQRLEESSNAAEKPTYCLFLWRQNPACQPDLRCHVVNPPSHFLRIVCLAWCVMSPQSDNHSVQVSTTADQFWVSWAGSGSTGVEEEKCFTGRSGRKKISSNNSGFSTM